MALSAVFIGRGGVFLRLGMSAVVVMVCGLPVMVSRCLMVGSGSMVMFARRMFVRSHG